MEQEHTWVYYCRTRRWS